MKAIIFTCMVTLFSTTYVRAQNLETELTPAELKSMEAREWILKTKDVEDSPWPEITYYALVEASPLESIAIFAAYDIQKDYVPNVIKSTPVKHITPTDVHTAYELQMPFPHPNAT